MSIFSKFLGTLTHAEEAVRSGLARAGIVGDTEVDANVTAFFAGDGKSALEEAAFRFALDHMKAVGKIVDFFDLGSNIFLIEKYKEVEVDYALDPAEIARRTNLGSEDWEYIGVAPTDLGKRTVKIAIGTLSNGWNEEGLEVLLARSNGKLKGSGAWVRESYIEHYPDHDGKGSISFPEPKSSRWRLVHDRGVYFPSIWRGDSRRWDRHVRWVGESWNRSDRLCLICESGH